MMRLFAGTAIAAGALLAGAAAQAADLPFKAVRPIVPAAFSWTGFYIGANVGAGADRASTSGTELATQPFAFIDPTGVSFVPAFPGVPTFVPGTIGSAFSSGGSSGSVAVIGGGQVGYNWQLERVLFGLEADVQFGSRGSQNGASATVTDSFPGVTAAGNITRTASANLSVERTWQSSFRGRLGYTWDRLLLYGTGGVSVTSVNANASLTATTVLGPALTPIAGITNPNGTSTTSERRTLVGGTVGAGAEYALTDRVSIGGEYRYTFYGRQSVNFGSIPGNTFGNSAPLTGTYSLDAHQGTIRLNFRL
jgi:outer membrane immunogenic protein